VLQRPACVGWLRLLILGGGGEPVATCLGERPRLCRVWAVEGEPPRTG